MTTPIGSFRVRAEPAEVDAFRQATQLVAEGDVLPLTYPMRWLVTAEIRATLLAMVAEPGLVLFHESQSFIYDRSLRTGEDYELALTARRETSPDRLIVDGILTGADGTNYATLEVILRLFSIEAAAA